MAEPQALQVVPPSPATQANPLRQVPPPPKPPVLGQQASPS